MEAIALSFLFALKNVAWQLGVLLGPILASCVLLHLLEKALNRKMQRLVGRIRIRVLGWLGVPIHELSHALLCVVFGHKIIEIQLFKPDEDGRLGYVRHSYSKRNIYQQIGNFFIGIAPLFGGSAALLAILFVVHPEPKAFFSAEFIPTFSAGALLPMLQGFAETGWKMTAGLFDPVHYSRFRFWLFVYLAMCVGSYLAPSREDLTGGVTGGVIVLALMFATNFALILLGFEVNHVLAGLSRYLTPVVSVLLLAIALNTVWLAVVSVLNIITGK